MMKKRNKSASARASIIKQEMNQQNNMARRMQKYQERVVNKPCRKKLKTGQ